MGAGLQKHFLVFENLIDAALPDVKLRTDGRERELAAAGLYPEPRPLDLDPGVLTLGKFLLATTKDQAHRVFLRDGIFAEATLRFEQLLDLLVELGRVTGHQVLERVLPQFLLVVWASRGGR
jgi:Domain of unknown function (DUF4416)